MAAGCAEKAVTQFAENPADYVTTLAGSLSEHSFSTGNTYPATALPWGMNFWDTADRQDGRRMGTTAMTPTRYAASSRHTSRHLG